MADGSLPVEGVDYTGGADIAALVAAGKVFACRYGGPGGSWKHLTPTEAQALSAAGIAIVANAEGSADGLRNGYAAGASWASLADAHFRACGMPPDRPIYFSVDFDTTSGDWAALDAAMDGAASVIGRNRVGVYGEFSIIEHLAANRKAVWYWQTYAWSGGRWSTHNHIEQYHNDVSLAGIRLDLDRAYGNDFGQWTTTATGGEGEMYASQGMGLNGSPISHDTMYLQEQMLFVVNADPELAQRLPEHPLTVDGKYGSGTAYWVSVLLTGGYGNEVTGQWFARLDQMVVDYKVKAAGVGQGPPGPQGPAGPAGPQGPKGDPGDAAVLAPGVELRVVEAS